ncbi:hypothetical protein BaRGS_00023542 [Batillaria attramentaria]|uniref:SSD domain-containing protein n=1 Tax=Batillaria attramentaria TaxID=370345 RepID=A0ABD0KDR2_9CAEN
MSACCLSVARGMLCSNYYIHVKRTCASVFFNFGEKVGRHPTAFSLAPLVLLLSMGVGMLVMEEETDTERLFTPVSARIFSDRKRMKELFKDSTSWNFDAFGLVDVPSLAVMIFRVTEVEGNASVFDIKYWIQIQRIAHGLDSVFVFHEGKKYGVEDLCARVTKNCAKDGFYLLLPVFVMELLAGRIKWPKFGQLDMSWNLGLTDIAPDDSLRGAKVMKLRVFWRVDRREQAKVFNRRFLEYMEESRATLTDGLQMAYSSSESLEVELDKGTRGDSGYFVLTLACMVVYSVAVTAGGDAVSTRALLACGGILAAGLGIIGSFGFLSVLGLRFVNFVGIMPFLVIGIGVDDMFLLMSAWAESQNERGLDVPGRVGSTFAKAGVGITITSLTDFLAFLIGFTSEFIAVRHFCVFTGVAVLLCYFANATLFGACLALHGQRVYSGHHWATCRPAHTREYLREQGAGKCKVFCCGGSIPAEGDFSDESPCEKLPRVLLPRLILNPIFKLLLCISFVVYLVYSIIGLMNLETGMRYMDLVLESSYYYTFSGWDMEYFGQRLAVAFAVDGEVDYRLEQGDSFLKLLARARKVNSMDRKFERCWLNSYRSSSYYADNTLPAFIDGVKQFLSQNNNSILLNDVKFNEQNTSITASRCYVMTQNVVNPFKQAEIMLDLRDLADSWGLPVFVYQPVFVMLEHTIAVYPATLQTVGTAVAVMAIVTFAFLPQPLMVLLVTLNILAIMTGVFGSMYYLDITFSGMSMIHLLMSIGFSVDFSAHICAAYLMSDAVTRKERAEYAIVHASGPIFNGGTSSLLGVAMLLFSESYFFVTFFQIMSIVIIAGAWHAVFVMPVVLSFIGPENTHLANTVSPAPGPALPKGGGEPLPDLLQNRNKSCNIDNNLADSEPALAKEDGDKDSNDVHRQTNSGETRGTDESAHSSVAAPPSTSHRRGQIPTGAWKEEKDWRNRMVVCERHPISFHLQTVLNYISSRGQLGASQAYVREVELPRFARDQAQRQQHDSPCSWTIADGLSSSVELGASQSYVQQARD